MSALDDTLRDDPCALILARIAEDLGMTEGDPPAIRDEVRKRNAAAHAMAKVLRELVALQDLHRSHAQAGAHHCRYPNADSLAVIDSLATDIARREPVAWAAAREAAAMWTGRK